MECPVCYEEGVTQGHECTTCNRITCCSKCFNQMPRKFCPLCRRAGAGWKPGDFGFISDEYYARPAIQETYESAMRHGIFDMDPRDTTRWEAALFNATERDHVGHSGASWGLALHHLRMMRDIGSWAGYVSSLQQAR